MTKTEYIKKHPKSYLSAKLLTTDWHNQAQIKVGGGLDTPCDKRSNLYQALQGTTGQYVLGGHRQRGTEGWWFAVLI